MNDDIEFASASMVGVSQKVGGVLYFVAKPHDT
jgi:hypothetical protein